MKKILFASTALVATAGVAAADVTLNGDGYMGIGYAEGAYIGTALPNGQFAETRDYAFIYDLDFQFVGTGETDGGLVFGAKVDADDASGAQGPLGWRGEMFISGAFGRLAMGDTGGAAELVVGDLAGVGLSGLGDFNENLYLLGAGPVCNSNGDAFDPQFNFVGCGQGALALYSYSVDAFTLGLGLNQDQGWSVGAGYTGGNFTVGLGYEYVNAGTGVVTFDGQNFQATTAVPNDTQQIIGQASFTFSNFTVEGVYGLIDLGKFNGKDTEIKQYGVSGSGTWGATTVTAFYRALDNNATIEYYGVGAAYDLGGGMAVEAGIVQVDEEEIVGGDTSTIADFGVSFKF